MACLASCTKPSPSSTSETAPATTDAPAVVPPADDASIFKYTITTDIDAKSDDINILVAMNSVSGQYPVKYDLDCEGDGKFEKIGLTDDVKCVYKKNTGKHQIWVRGEIPAMFLCAKRREDIDCGPDVPKEKLITCDLPLRDDHSAKAVVSIDSWGNIPWKSMAYFAAECEALNKLPEDSPDLSQVSDMNDMFYKASSFNQPLENWNVSKVTNMVRVFYDAAAFNQPLEKWNVSNVTNMAGMFYRAVSFNQPLEKWNVSNVTNMASVFHEAVSFNQPLENWNVSKVTQMAGMFFGASSFNQPLEKWNVSNVADMSWMFTRASLFDQPLEKWNVSNVTDMSGMFMKALWFNQPIEKWNVSNVTDMSDMFHKAVIFNQPLDKWDVSKVENMDDMFNGAEAFSYYPKDWVVPAGYTDDMFNGTKVEEEARKSPLKTK